jgi:peptide/nickel transport system permease protein
MRIPPTLRFVWKRLIKALPLLAAVVVFNFCLLKLAPGDAAEVLAGEAASATPEYLADLKSRFGLDQPAPIQLMHYVLRLAQFDLGYSFRHNQTVLQLVLGRMSATLILMAGAISLAVLIGTALGIAASRKVNSLRDTLISIFALLTFATPVFWLGLMLIVLFAVQLGWLPSSGMETVGAGYRGFARLLDIGRHMTLPVLTLALFFVALYTRVMRASMLEVFNQDYVRTARAKGLSERRIAMRHVVRNALLPVVTLFGLQLGTMLGGSVLVETVFSWPGLGRLAFEAVAQRDINLLLGILLLCSFVVIAANILVDIAYAKLDPRIRLA